jgi:hypothetical protein
LSDFLIDLLIELNWLIWFDWLIDSFIHWLTKWMTDWLIYWMTDLLIDWFFLLIDCLID